MNVPSISGDESFLGSCLNSSIIEPISPELIRLFDGVTCLNLEQKLYVFLGIFLGHGVSNRDFGKLALNRFGLLGENPRVNGAIFIFRNGT